MVTNSFILCRDFTDLPYKSVKDFQVALAKELIGSYASRDQAVPVTPLLYVGSAKPTSPHEEQRTVDAVTTATTTKSKGTRQCGFAKTATSSCVTMDVMMTASEYHLKYGPSCED